MPATFAWAKGLESHPIAAAFEVPAGSGWRAATQLVPTGDSLRFTAPDLQYFFDSPTELSGFGLRSWTVPRRGGGADTIRLAVHHAGTDSALDAYAEMAKKVVAEHIGVYGEAPPFDRGTYTFIADYLPWASGDGMEHRNSTILSSSASLERADALLGTLSHEFAHAWNIERIRPVGVEPFDFTRANSSDALWYGEGFTSYYDDLTIRRAGLTSDSAYAESLGGLVGVVVNANGRRYFNALEMSRQAPFVDAATSIDPTNRANTFLSYYTWGAGIGLGLDLSIRERFQGKTLDGFMRAMWERYGRNERPFTVKRPYTVDDLERTLGEYVGDAAWARDFFAKYVRGRDVVDYARLLAQAGFLVRAAHPGAGTLGQVPVQFDSAGARVIGPTLVGTPIYDAGVERGDLIVSVGGAPATTGEAFAAAVRGKGPGERVELVFEQRGERRSATVPLIEDPRLEAVTFEAAGRELTRQQRAFRAAWLGSRAGR
jgi:predicted metalloprotease with PDZ domain